MDGSAPRTKPTSYRETFRRHRLLLSLPIILAVFVAAWFELGAPKSYQSTASLWVDTPTSTDSSLGNANPALTPPSQQEQSVFTELLATQSFVLAAGHNSALAQYLATHSSSGFSPTALLSGLSGGGSVDARIVGSFGPKQVLTAIPGPQVLEISYRGPTPEVAQSTLAALVKQLQQDSNKFSAQRNQAVIAYDQAQVKAAAQAVATERVGTSAYLRQHPGAGNNDPNLSALQTAAGAASGQLTQTTQRLSEAESASNNSSANGSTISVIDPATMPAGPVSGKKKELMAIVGGLFAGLLISFLGAVALTPKKADSWDADLPSSPVPSSPVPSSPLPWRPATRPENRDVAPANGDLVRTASTNGEQTKAPVGDGASPSATEHETQPPPRGPRLAGARKLVGRSPRSGP
jgi:uncharacterized protein involved in exopolysaccharide biosynthesis